MQSLTDFPRINSLTCVAVSLKHLQTFLCRQHCITRHLKPSAHVGFLMMKIKLRILQPTWCQIVRTRTITWVMKLKNDQVLNPYVYWVYDSISRDCMHQLPIRQCNPKTTVHKTNSTKTRWKVTHNNGGRCKKCAGLCKSIVGLLKSLWTNAMKSVSFTCTQENKHYRNT